MLCIQHGAHKANTCGYKQKREAAKVLVGPDSPGFREAGNPVVWHEPELRWKAISHNPVDETFKNFLEEDLQNDASA